MWEKLKKILKEDIKFNNERIKENEKTQICFKFYLKMDKWVLKQMKILEKKEKENGETKKN